MTEILEKVEEQRNKAIEMGGHLKDLAATYNMEDDLERHLLKMLCEAYAQEQTRYEYMKLQAASSTTPAPPYQGGEPFAGAAA